LNKVPVLIKSSAPKVFYFVNISTVVVAVVRKELPWCYTSAWW